MPNVLIAWAVLNRAPDYVAELRRKVKVPVFSISSSHAEIGRIQGRQFAALLPDGGAVLYIEGPSQSSSAKERTAGMLETKPANLRIKMLKGQWTEESARRTVVSWLSLAKSEKVEFDLVAAQDDSMAIGARKALQEQADEAVRAKWLSARFTGCDGLPTTGQEYVRSGLLAATVIVPPNTKLAIEMLVAAIQQGKTPAELALTVPISFPTIEELAKASAKKQ